jgi:hypothetical protein
MFLGQYQSEQGFVDSKGFCFVSSFCCYPLKSMMNVRQLDSSPSELIIRVSSS